MNTILKEMFSQIFKRKHYGLKAKFRFLNDDEIIDQADKKGYSYETLEGHVEKGVSTFTVEQLDNKIVFKIQTYSTPGNILTKLLGPIFSVPYQTFCTKTALKNVKRQLENQ